MKWSQVFLLGMFSFSLASCSTGPKRHASLIKTSSDKMWLSITKREWGGVLGPHGYVGHQWYGYCIELDGVGPIFTNPPFHDNPPDFRCVDTVTLDRDHDRVIVNMRRVISKPGAPEHTRPHPGNGTYTIESIRSAKTNEYWFN